MALSSSPEEEIYTTMEASLDTCDAVVFALNIFKSAAPRHKEGPIHGFLVSQVLEPIRMGETFKCLLFLIFRTESQSMVEITSKTLVNH